MKNYYGTLGLGRKATHDEIKSAYRKYALKFHPDRNGGGKYFEEKFKKIQEAYEVLSDTNKKKKYDFEYDVYFGTNQEEIYTEKQFKKSSDEYETQQKRNSYSDKEKNLNKIKAELDFEDKAWIFIGNWFIIPGAVGLWMFFKYRKDGFITKSNTVCKLTIISFITFLILGIVMILAQEVGKSNY